MQEVVYGLYRLVFHLGPAYLRRLQALALLPFPSSTAIKIREELRTLA